MIDQFRPCRLYLSIASERPFIRLTVITEAAWAAVSHEYCADNQRRLEAMLQRYDLQSINYFDPYAPENTRSQENEKNI